MIETGWGGEGPVSIGEHVKANWVEGEVQKWLLCTSFWSIFYNRASKLLTAVGQSSSPCLERKRNFFNSFATPFCPFESNFAPKVLNVKLIFGGERLNKVKRSEKRFRPPIIVRDRDRSFPAKTTSLTCSTPTSWTHYYLHLPESKIAEDILVHLFAHCQVSE